MELAVATRLCLYCGRPPELVTVTQPPLLRHGDYGEATRTTLAVCCAVEIIAVDAINPRVR